MAEEDDPLRVPAISGEDVLQLDSSVVKEIEEKLAPLDRACVWCRIKSRHEVAPTVFTAVTFAIPMDAHIHSKVSPTVAVHCTNCGHTQWFNMHKLGFTTKNGRRQP